MPDTRKHRGPHPADAELFRLEFRPVLREAVSDLSWLMTRGYAATAALKLVGDRFRLAERQRIAVRRSSCSDQSLADRRSRQVVESGLAGQTICVDGFNVLTTIEAALSGGILLHGKDGCYRDMASMHGSYRKVEETRPALKLVGEALEDLEVGCCRWFLDRPVSNSGRLSQLIRDTAAECGWPWESELVADPDRDLMAMRSLVVSADSQILDHCHGWFNLARTVVDQCIPTADVVCLVFEECN